MAKNTNIVKFKKPENFSIGILLAVFVFVYLFVQFFSYITEKDVAVYEVQPGTLSSDTNYRAFVIRDEAVVYAGESGYLDYYFAEGDRLSTRSLVCSVDEDGSTSKSIKEVSKESSDINSENYKVAGDAVDSFLLNYEASDFTEAYTLSGNISTNLTTIYNTKALSELASNNEDILSNPSFHLYYPSTVGDVSYTIDGFEDINLSNITPSVFDSGYKANKLFTHSTVTAGEPLYKIVTSEDWTLLIEVDENTAKALDAQEVVKVHFHADDGSAWAYCSSIEMDGKYYGVLSLYSAMVRYISDRYLNIELDMAEEDGLKIPTSSIVTKEFYIIPEQYFFVTSDSRDLSLELEETDSKGNITHHSISPTIYHQDERGFYVDKSCFESNTMIIKPESTDRYIPAVIGTLDGVYNINKGYATFKMIDIIYQNENYTVVRTKTDYGLAMYDHILLDGSTASENEIIYK